MDNQLSLIAQIKTVQAVRYTPAGLPVLMLWLSHESWQTENAERYLAKFEIEAKIIGEAAIRWQHSAGSMVKVSGFLAQKGRRYPKPILHIQNIYEYKG